MKIMEKYLQLLCQNIKKIANELELSQTEFLEKCKVSRSFISNIKKSIPTIDKILNISQYTNCSIDYLLGLTDVKEIITSDRLRKNIPPEDKRLLDKYRNLCTNNKSIVDYILEMDEESVEPTKIYYFPVFYQSAAAGIGRLSETNDYQMEELELNDLPSDAKFGMYIKGDSMEKTIFENDIVLIDPSKTMPDKLDGDIVVALFGEELVCKKLSVNSDMQTYDFISNNPEANDKSRWNQKRGSFTLVGKVVKIIHAQETGNGLFTYIED